MKWSSKEEGVEDDHTYIRFEENKVNVSFTPPSAAGVPIKMQHSYSEPSAIIISR